MLSQQRLLSPLPVLNTAFEGHSALEMTTLGHGHQVAEIFPEHTGQGSGTLHS